MTTPRIIQFQVTGAEDEEGVLSAKQTVWALDDEGQIWIGYMATLTPVSWQWDKVDGPTG
jgi:hypothetical protein